MGIIYSIMKSASIALATIAVASGVQVEKTHRRDPLLTWAPTVRGSGHPTNYFVPHFGEDHDIKNTKASYTKEEQRQGHFWSVSDPPADPPRNYFVPNFGVDQDVKDSLQHLGDQEAKHGSWNLPKDDWFVQLNRDPLLTWSPRKKAGGYPMDYGVPHFGSDAEVTDSLKFANAAEGTLGHKWELKTDPDTEKFVVPEPYSTWDGHMW